MKQFSNKQKWWGFTAVTLVLLAMVGFIARFTAAAPFTGTTTVVSVDSEGNVGLVHSEYPAISADGRFVVFQSNWLASEDTSLGKDVYVHDRQAGETSLVSVASDGTMGNAEAWPGDISGDGRYVVFDSQASTLIAGDTNGRIDIFLHDRQTGETSRISVDSDGDQVPWHSMNPVISQDGRYVAFRSEGDFESGVVTEGYDLFVKDRQTGEVTLVSATYDGSMNIVNANDPFISANGDYILFWSAGTAFVEGDTNGANDVFFYDRQADELSIVSVASDGSQGIIDSEVASVTADGRYVAFVSEASNLVAGDTNAEADIFLHDRQTGETSRISIGLAGEEADGNSKHPQISADGRTIVFASYATNLVTGDTNNRDDVFVYDRDTEEISLVSVSTAEVQGNNTSYSPDVSADGQHIAFQSYASNLVAVDDNGNDDIFVHSLSELTTPSPTLSLNFNTGRPGSFFWAIGVGFPSGEPAILEINGQVITDTLQPVDDFGNFRFILDSINADPGFYTVRLIFNSNATTAFTTSTAATNTSAIATFTLDAEAPLRPQEGDGVVLQVPAGIAFNHQTFLPVVVR